jgi:S-adenosylmethionine decarboxylase
MDGRIIARGARNPATRRPKARGQKAVAKGRLLSYPRTRSGNNRTPARVSFFSVTMLTVGTEWLIEASGCDPALLRDVGRLREVFARAIRELDLRVVGEQLWHKFPGAGGATGLAMLTESHLACHTYPEFGVATFNLYCCRERAAWPWDERLREMLGAADVHVRGVVRSAAEGHADARAGGGDA